MSTVMSIKTANKTNLSNLQKTFNRLKKKIGVLQNQLKETEDTLEQGLCFFKTEVSPLKSSLANLLYDFIKITYKHYKNSKKLSKKVRDWLKEQIIYKCHDVSLLIDSVNDIDLEVQNILKNLNGVGYQDMFNDDLESGKSMLSEMFKEANLDVDLSLLDSSDDPESIMKKVIEAMFEAEQKQKAENPSSTKPKSKKQLQKESKAKELEKLQHEGLGKIYKQLAKALHPDLEQDPTIREEKEQVMKRITTAYKNEDLHTLLSIEMEWLDREESDEREGMMQSDQQLKIYNSLLKDQIDELEMTIAWLPSNMRYFCMNIANVNDVRNILPELKEIYRDLRDDIMTFTEALSNLSSSDGEKYLLETFGAQNI